MAKESKAPTVSDRLATVERLIARDQEEILRQKDPFSLNDERPQDQLVQESEEGDLRQALARPEIRRVFYRLMQLGDLMTPEGDPNQIVMAHRVGRRSLALDFYNAMKKIDPGWYWQAEREAESNSKSREIKNGAE